MVSMLRTIRQLPFLRTVHGRQAVSLWASRIFEHTHIRKLFGVNLVAAVIYMGYVTPQAIEYTNRLNIEQKMQATPISARVETQTTFDPPLVGFKISQTFSSWHPGIDATAPEGTPVYAIAEGYVTETGYTLLGYGKHVIITHEHNIISLYAHLSQIKTVRGRKISRGELIGEVGATGWATGNHLHLEIYQNGIPVNPLELLPFDQEKIAYDGAFYQNQTPPPSPASTAITAVVSPQ